MKALIRKMLNNPMEFIRNASDEDLLKVFPAMKQMGFNNIDEYRESLVKSLNIGSMELNFDY